MSAVFEPVASPRAGHWMLTDVCLAAALAFAFFVAHDALLGLNLMQSGLKHLVGVAMACACTLCVVGDGIVRGRGRPAIAGLRLAWLPLALLALLIIAGSLYARTQLDIQNTFLIVGLYTAIGFGFVLVLRGHNTLRIVGWVLALAAVFGVLVAAETLGARLANPHVRDTVIHEREFIVVPLLYPILFVWRAPRLLRAAAFVLILGSTVAALKNTPTLVLALTLLMIGWRLRSVIPSTNNSVKRALVLYLLFLALLALAVAYGLYVLQVRDVTPVGNVDFRQHQYRVAWQEFLASPLIGTLFTGSTGIYFDLWVDPVLGAGALPTHSDVLDFLRAGGLLAGALWALPLVWVWSRSIAVLWRAGRRDAWTRELDLLAWLLLASVGSVVVYTFNPLLAKTALATLVWVFFALLTAMSYFIAPARSRP
ncbi:hypothetical protein CKO44_21805 [Rubrivivax gelatinosus]|uniref:hypothetical protein n=1 Tax=Rubrivivax gelatinosus TaxID=28068 RepID=UPI0019060DB4|nr:hypothetical protein [Rubrivivax gelatinosus]MBK1616094.1 hypothetical protein [Rubrivivax gelatinosus]